MKEPNQILGLILILMFGCNLKNNVKEPKLDVSTLKLETLEDKKNYLEKILEDDQKFRGSQDSEIMLKYGKDSDEFRKFIQKRSNQDSINLSKIEKYFEIYGYPNKNELGEIAAFTPWAVIHHANTYEERERNFQKLYEAYLNKNIDDASISRFLGRMYRIKNGELLRMEGPFKSEDEINQLINKLNLEEKKTKALKSVDL